MLTLGQLQVGEAITVVVSYTDVGSTVETVTSSPTSAVSNINDAPTITTSTSIQQTKIQQQLRSPLVG